MECDHSEHLASGPMPLPGARHGRDPDRAIKRGPRRVSAEAVAATQRDRLFDGLVHEVATEGLRQRAGQRHLPRRRA